MKRLWAFVFLTALSAAFTSPAQAVSWSPLQEEQEEKAAKGVIVTGDRVCLFQSGTSDVQKEIHVNDILVVFRETRDHRLIAVGKIRVLSFVGADYLKAEVIEGELMAGDIARKGDVASLIISPSDKCNERGK